MKRNKVEITFNDTQVLLEYLKRASLQVEPLSYERARLSRLTKRFEELERKVNEKGYSYSKADEVSKTGAESERGYASPEEDAGAA